MGGAPTFGCVLLPLGSGCSYRELSPCFGGAFALFWMLLPFSGRFCPFLARIHAAVGAFFLLSVFLPFSACLGPAPGAFTLLSGCICLILGCICSIFSAFALFGLHLPCSGHLWVHLLCFEGFSPFFWVLLLFSGRLCPVLGALTSLRVHLPFSGCILLGVFRLFWVLSP